MDYEDNDSYVFDLNKIANLSSTHSSVKLLAHQMMINPYHRIGPFLTGLSDHDIKTLLDICEKQAHDQDVTYEPFENIMLLGMMLATGEGVEVNDESVYTITNIMVAMITMESLRRKGFVKVFYDKVSFGPEFAQEKVVVKTDKMDKYIEGLEDDEGL
jgi:hypothetical protein